MVTAVKNVFGGSRSDIFALTPDSDTKRTAKELMNIGGGNLPTVGQRSG